MTPLVSIITPTYNQADFIGPCIESVLNQSYQHWQMIIIDDQSDDATGQIARSYIDSRIEVVTQPHRGLLGLADTYNVGLKRASGELIAILEGDDFWPRDRLRALVPAFNDREVVLAYGLAQLTTTAGVPFERYIPEPRRWKEPNVLANSPLGSASLVLAMGETFCFPVSTMIRSSALRSIGGFRGWPSLRFVDLPTFLRISAEGRFMFVPQVVGYWRQVMGSGTRTRDEIEAAHAMSDLAIEFFDKYGPCLEVPPLSEDEIVTHHLQATRELALKAGRLHLLRGDPDLARRAFVQVLSDLDSPFHSRARALVGVVCAWLGVDVEWIVRALKGRESDMRWIFSMDVTSRPWSLSQRGRRR